MFSWTSLVEIIKLGLQVVVEFINLFKEAKLKKQGAEEKEKEIEDNEKVVRDVLTNTDVSSLPDDEAFKPRQK